MIARKVQLLGDLPLLHLLQLSSSLVPIGAFAYSQGLEQAVERGWVSEEQGVARWILGVGASTLQYLDLPLLLRAREAWAAGDVTRALRWSQRVLCSREASELLEQELHLGRAFARVLSNLNAEHSQHLAQSESRSYVAAYALGAHHYRIEAQQAALGYSFAWVEQQVNAAQRLLPFGHMAGQRVLAQVLEAVPDWVSIAAELPEEQLGSVTPGLAMASAWHEQQYSRMFRS